MGSSSRCRIDRLFVVSHRCSSWGRERTRSSPSALSTRITSAPRSPKSLATHATAIPLAVLGRPSPLPTAANSSTRIPARLIRGTPTLVGHRDTPRRPRGQSADRNRSQPRRRS